MSEKKQTEEKYNQKQQSERTKYIISRFTTLGHKWLLSLGIRKSKYSTAKEQKVTFRFPRISYLSALNKMQSH